MRRIYVRIVTAIVGLSLVVFYLLAGGIVSSLIIIIAYNLDSASLALLALAPLGFSGHRIIIKVLPKFYDRFSNAPGNARMGGIKDLRKANLLGIDRQGIYCGLLKQRPVFYRGEGHIVTIGPPRTGKGMALAVPNIWYSRRSLVVLDPKAELAAITCRYRSRLGPALVINPLGVLVDTHPHLRSCGFNPFVVPSFRQDLFSACGSIAKSLIPITGTKEEFFPLGARELIQCLMMMTVLEGRSNASFRDVNQMLRLPYSSEDAKARTIQKLMRACAQSQNRELANLCNQFTEGNRTNDSILASARIPLTNLNNSRLLNDLGKHPIIKDRPFDFEMLKHEISTVYIVLPDDRLTEYNFWLRMILANALDALKSTIPGEINPLFLIDEAGNLGYLEALKEAMGMAAGKGVTLWTFWQSIGQLRQQYGDHGASAFLSGASVTNAFGGVDLETAKYLSEMMGYKTEVTARYSQNSNEMRSSGKSEAASGYALRRPETIMAMKKGLLLSFINAQPYELDAPGYFDLKMAGLDPNPYRRRKVQTFTGWKTYART